MSDSSTALSTANTANTNASQAKTDASSAKSTATTAKNTADTAKSTADSAKQTATTANTNASTALSTANSAKTTADSALSAANTANSNVTASKDTIAKELGYSSFADMQAKPTIIDGGYIRTSYLESEAIRATIVTASYLSTLSITTGKLTVTDGAKIGSLLVCEDENKTAIIIGKSTLGSHVAIGGTEVGIGITVKPISGKSTTGLKIYTEGSNNVALNIWAQNSNVALRAFEGCDWVVRTSSFWRMPGLLWCARCDGNGGIYDQFGNGCYPTTPSIQKLGTGKFKVTHNLGHGKYVPYAIAHENGNWNCANITDVQYNYFSFQMFHKDQGNKDSGFYVSIHGMPSDRLIE